jgi:hypothetical protein
MLTHSYHVERALYAYDTAIIATFHKPTLIAATWSYTSATFNGS